MLHTCWPPLTARWVQAFLDAGVPCAAPAYLVDWVSQPWQPLDSHRLYNTAPSSELLALEDARRWGGEVPTVSMSF
jgi:hypothetical protein